MSSFNYISDETYLKLFFIFTKVSFDLMLSPINFNFKGESNIFANNKDVSETGIETIDDGNVEEYNTEKKNKNIFEKIMNFFSKIANNEMKENDVEEFSTESNIDYDTGFKELPFETTSLEENTENNENNDTSIAGDTTFFRPGEETIRILFNKPIKFFIERIDDIQIFNNTQGEECTRIEYTQEEFMNMFKSNTGVLIKSIIVNLFPSFLFMMKNLKMLQSIFLSLPHYDALEPKYIDEIDNSNIRNFIEIVEKESIQKREEIINDINKEVKRIDYMKNIMNKISNINIKNSFDKILDNIVEYINDNFDILIDKFKYMIEKYYENSAYYVLEILSVFFFHICIYNIMKFEETSRDVIRVNKEFLKNYKVFYN